jgi:hypothetical protein
MSQYLQLISNTSSPTPLDVWLPADYIKPQIVIKLLLGISETLKTTPIL